MVNFKSLALVATAFFSLGLSAPVSDASGKIIKGSYIVTLKADVEAKAHLTWVEDVHKRSLSKRDEQKGVERTYDGKYGFHGYAGTFDKDTISEIKENPDVSLIPTF